MSSERLTEYERKRHRRRTPEPFKRLAMPTEDHPLAYADFEGTIAQDEYGGGSVIVWDTGTYRDLSETGTSVEDAVNNGHLKVLRATDEHGVA